MEKLDGMNKRVPLAVGLIFIMFINSVPLIKAQSASSIVINPDGSITGTYSIQQVGSTYTLIGNISGNIQVEKSNIVINGDGYSLDGNGNGGIDLTNSIQHEPTNPTISNITIENLYILNSGVSTNGGGSDTFYNDFFLNCGRSQGGFAIQLLGCCYNNISYCNFDDESIIAMDYQANFNVVTECNLPSNGGILVWLSGGETVDRNYWSDYLTKYPNATEIDNSGVGNQPYVYATAQNGTQTIYYQDNHPLMKPVIIPLTGSSSPSPTVPEFPALTVLPLLLLAFSVALILRHRKTRNLKQ